MNHFYSQTVTDVPTVDADQPWGITCPGPQICCYSSGAGTDEKNGRIKGIFFI